MLSTKFVIISKNVRVFCKQWGHYHHKRFGARVQRHSSTSSDESVKTMLLAKFVIISKMCCSFVNNGGIILTSDFGPRSKDTLAPLVVKILKQCYRYWQNLLSFQRCNGVLQTVGALTSGAALGQGSKTL